MDSHSMLTILEQSHVSPPPAVLGFKSLKLTLSDIIWLTSQPAHTLFFYELPITKAKFIETIVPNIKQSLSITLQHFYPFVGKLAIFPSGNKTPEIRYVEGDSVTVTFAECDLDFNDLTGNHPRECDKFYHLIPILGHSAKVSDYITIPVFAVQVTLFPNYGISIGLTSHHSLCDASAVFGFLKAWASIARSGGSDELFLANGTLPVYDRLVKYPKLDESYLKKVVETFNEEYKLPRLSGPTDKVRATFILARTVINGLKKLVSTQFPMLAHVSSYTIACAYIWNCVAKLHNDELAAFVVAIDCRSRMDPPIPASYFGNCLHPCISVARTSVLKGKEGFLTAAKLIGENLHKMLSDKDGLMKDEREMIESLFRDGGPTTSLGVAGSPKLGFYDLDFGFGKPRKYEMVSLDYNEAISMNASRESNEDLEIGVCLSAAKMDVFVDAFNSGVESVSLVGSDRDQIALTGEGIDSVELPV